jgi:superfamily II DNA or RNA helicase
VTISRYSSRRGQLGSLLTDRLDGALSYDRIAGYFSSSILEIAGEAIDSMADGALVRVVCNSHLDALDVLTAKAAKQAIFQEWCAALPSTIDGRLQARLRRLYGLLAAGRLVVRVLPDERFGLIHGKAGVIHGADRSAVSFLGSANETQSGWSLNYELIWTDESAEAVSWVQDEFEALWTDGDAVELADAVIKDIDRLARRAVVPSVEAWREVDAPAASPIVELPVYRREAGLWAHQKAFIQLAFDAHRRGGARYVLADQVGLGKTVQLALAAKLMALWGEGRVLVLVPKPLLEQWQDELWRLLELPSALWTGRGWTDELGVEHGDRSLTAFLQCPRRVALVSTGIVTQAAEFAAALATGTYECVILDEAHRARRRNLNVANRTERPDPNNLLRFLQRVSNRTRSMLLATATPVQVDPIEAFDLLDALGGGSDAVIGSSFSTWRREPPLGIAYVTGRAEPNSDVRERWEWIRDPLPPATEGRDFAITRQALGLSDDQAWARSSDLDKLRPPDRSRLERLGERFFQAHHPYIRAIVRRSREFLETKINEETNEPYLPPIGVRLFGERPSDAIPLPPFLEDAYQAAEAFCQALGGRPGLNSGFLKTLLLRRVGSSMQAGRRTAEKMLGPEAMSVDEEDEAVEEERPQPPSALYPLTPTERTELDRFLRLLTANRDEDPKARVVERILATGVDGTQPWIDVGCIVFSQYLDSARWLAERLSKGTTESVGLYAGGSSSGVFADGAFSRISRDELRNQIASGVLRLVVGTDAASEGLNLQKLSSLINLDLPWNPTRLEQRKGRIQRIGQIRDEVWIYNMRYQASVEDRVHELLSERLESIRDMFGQIPDTLEDVWVQVALDEEERARQVIDAVPPSHPFEMRYDKVEAVDFESCSEVLESESQLEVLRAAW